MVSSTRSSDRFEDGPCVRRSDRRELLRRFHGACSTKRDCDADGDSLDEFSKLMKFCTCLLSVGVAECSDICFKHPVLKDWQWSTSIACSPGAASYSEEACSANLEYDAHGDSWV